MANKNRLVWTNDVMAFLCKRCNEMYPDEPCEPSDCLMLEELDKCNSVDAVPVVHGHWFSLTDCSNAGVYCSVCHKKVWKEDYAWCNRKNKLRSNYCPNCGSKMDLEVE